MPEMPEVRTMTVGLRGLVIGKKINRLNFVVEKIAKELSPIDFSKKLEQEKIINVENIGKWIVFNFSNEKILLSHLRMTGTYFFYESKPKELQKHLCVRMEFTDGSELHYVDSRKFGTMQIRNKENFLATKPLKGLAKEPENTKTEDFWNKLQKTSRAIKTVILDQKHVLGFGNIYVDETLWKVNVHPETPANKISKEEASNILKVGSEIMNKATQLGGSSIRTYGSVNGKAGEYQNHLKVFDRAGKECFRCSETLQKSRVNGRGTVTCPKCQNKK